MATRKSANTNTGSSRQGNRSQNSRGGQRSASSRSNIDYWRIAGGVAGVAVTAFLLFTMLGGRRGLGDKAREVLDWESEGHSPGSEFGESLKSQRGDNEGLSAH